MDSPKRPTPPGPRAAAGPIPVDAVFQSAPYPRNWAEWQRRKEALVDYLDAARADLHWDTRGKILTLLALVADLVRVLPASDDPDRLAAELDALNGQVAALRGRLGSG